MNIEFAAIPQETMTELMDILRRGLEAADICYL